MPAEMLVSIGPAFVGLMVVLAVQAAVLLQSNFGSEGLPESKWGKRLYDWHLWRALINLVPEPADAPERQSFELLRNDCPCEQRD